MTCARVEMPIRSCVSLISSDTVRKLAPQSNLIRLHLNEEGAFPVGSCLFIQCRYKAHCHIHNRIGEGQQSRDQVGPTEVVVFTPQMGVARDGFHGVDHRNIYTALQR